MSTSRSDSPPSLSLTLLPEVLAVCRLEAGAPLPAWVLRPPACFGSLTRTRDELSVVCEQDVVPPGETRVARGWRALKVRGPLDLSLTGVVASLTAPLAAAAIPVFVLSTYDTDYLLVRGEALERAIAVLRKRFAVEATG